MTLSILVDYRKRFRSLDRAREYASALADAEQRDVQIAVKGSTPWLVSPKPAAAPTGSRPPELVGYVRVSTSDQDTDSQADALRGAGCVKPPFRDVITGTSESRAGLDACLTYLQRGDTLCVWAIDRFGRSLQHLLKTIAELEARGVKFRSLQEPFIDTSSPAGELVLSIFGAVAQFERKHMIARVNATLTAKRLRGEKVGGRRVKLDADTLKMARASLQAGESRTTVARNLKVDRATLYRALERTDEEILAVDRRESDARARSKQKTATRRVAA